MSRKETDLSSFNNDWYRPGKKLRIAVWYICNVLFFINPLFAFSGVKCALLRLFGARVGPGVVIKPGVSIKYPWKLSIGAHSWIGERCWIDNLGEVQIGAHCCLSQGAMLLCGNHDYKKTSFDLVIGDITIENGAWIGARAMVTPGTTVQSHAVLAVESVASGTLKPYTIYKGNPAEAMRERVIES